MTRIFVAMFFLVFVTACGDGQPFFEENSGDVGADGGNTEGSSGDGDTGDGIVGDDNLPPGTERPSRSSGIIRFEARNGNGGGYAQDFIYNADDDTFTIDNLGFDGENVYQRGDVRSTLGTYAVYDADTVVIDPISGDDIGQVVPYRAVLGISANRVDGEARTNFAFVRSGAFLNYGFGGYVYERNGPVTLPSTGQAGFRGGYAGIRVYTNRSGFDYVEGDIHVAIDFEDFNANDAVSGRIFNRAAFDEGGVPVTDLALPNIHFNLSEGAAALNSTGEISGTLSSSFVFESGEEELYEDGTYFGIIAGDTTDPDDGGEIVGIIVVESEDHRYEDVTAQETGGFIVYR